MNKTLGMKTIRFFKLLFLLGIFNFSCSNGHYSDSAPVVERMAPKQVSVETADQPEVRSGQKIIKHGFISFETDDLEKTYRDIKEAVKKYKGYIASENVIKDPNRITYQLDIRVPAENFDNLVEDITKEATFLDVKNISMTDVTEEFTDINARLKAKKELEKRYLELLKQAQNVKEMLEIERQLAQLRGEIESIEGRLKYLQNHVRYASLSVSFYKKTNRLDGFGTLFIKNLKNGWNNFMAFLLGIVNLWPFILIILFVLWAIRRWRRRRKSSDA